MIKVTVSSFSCSFNHVICALLSYFGVFTIDIVPDEVQLHARTITRLKGKYANVVGKIKCAIEQQKYDTDQLILNLSATDDENQTIFSTDEAFVKITNTNQLFLWIGKYCNIVACMIMSCYWHLSSPLSVKKP